MFRLVLFILLLITTGCGKFSSGGASGLNVGASLVRKPYGTCDRKNVTTINLCMEAVGPEYNEVGYLDILKSSCESSGGEFSTANCPTTDAFGICIIAPGQPNMTYISYYPPQYTAASAAEACRNGGGIYRALTQ